MSLKVKLFTLVLASLLSTADLLRCYVCSGEECTSAPMTCPEPTNYCMTIVNPDAEYEYRLAKRLNPDAKYEHRITKGCEYSTTQADCGKYLKVGSREVYCCNTDLCNGAGTIEKSLLLLLVPLASIFMLS